MTGMETHRYCSGRVERVTPDGAHWREASPAELADLPRRYPEHRVIVGHGEPNAAGEFADLLLPGRFPYLAGISALIPVYVEVVCVEAA